MMMINKNENDNNNNNNDNDANNMLIINTKNSIKNFYYKTYF
jgi:hypothetical protein